MAAPARRDRPAPNSRRARRRGSFATFVSNRALTTKGAKGREDSGRMYAALNHPYCGGATQAKASMARTDFSTPRLCVQSALASGESLTLSAEQANYLLNVLRLREGARVLAFNGRDGEFASSLAPLGKKGAALRIDALLRAQEYPGDIDYLFAPLKHARLDYVAQKAVEMGVRRLCPVITRRTQVARVNIERLRANAQEAAEQCGVIWLAEIAEAGALTEVLADWPARRVLVFCDEEAPRGNAAATLASRAAPAAIGLLIGPEGGFDEDERAMILRAPDVVRLSLGPRILRADTAAVAALALIQAHWGDWR